MKELQKLVAEMVAARGYREGWTPEQFAARQVCKAAEELGELQTAIEWRSWAPNWTGGLQFTSLYARQGFDSLDDWRQVVDVDATIAAEELADVAIPLLAMADALGIDLEAAIRAKVTGDVVRGVRGAEQKAHDLQDAMAMTTQAAQERRWIPLADLRPGAIFETQNGERAVKRWSNRLFQKSRICECTSLNGGVYMTLEGDETLVREIVIK